MIEDLEGVDVHEVVIAEKKHRANLPIMRSDQNALMNSSRPTCEAAKSYPAFPTSAVRHGVAQPNIAAPFAAIADPA